MTYQPQKDFGTPESRSDETVSLTIDGRNVTVPAGTSVMRAAAEQGTSIPNYAPPTALKASAHAACAWSKSMAAEERQRVARRLWNPAWLCARKPRIWQNCAKA